LSRNLRGRSTFEFIGRRPRLQRNWHLEEHNSQAVPSRGNQLTIRSFGILAWTIGTFSWLALAQPPAGRGPGQGGRGGGGNPFAKAPELPANLFAAASTVARTTLKHEWVDIPMGRGKLHTWVEYPAGEAKAPVVLVMHYDAGLDDLQQALVDQLATDGFIAVAPDLLSGLGPNGGNYEAFKYPDQALRAVAKIDPAESLRRYKAAYDYAKNLPRSSGKVASLGCGVGGTNSFRFATEVPDLSAAVVIYGMPPSEAAMAKIQAPVLGLYGADDASVIATVEPTIAAMKKLKKSYEQHMYPGATHFFMTYVVEGRNGEAVAQGWPAAIAFLREHTK
jgi:carboxymethylenebutenolidase